jgi:hypothetical protein
MGLPAQQGSKRGFCAFTLDGIQLFVFEQRRRQRFCLYREADVPQPVRHDDLTLDEVRRDIEYLETSWAARRLMSREAFSEGSALNMPPRKFLIEPSGAWLEFGDCLASQPRTALPFTLASLVLSPAPQILP